jgi:hypothetical protein
VIPNLELVSKITFMDSRIPLPGGDRIYGGVDDLEDVAGWYRTALAKRRMA